MSHPSPPSRSSGDPAQDAKDRRELEAFFRQQDPVKVAAADWHTRWEQGLTAAEQSQLERWLGTAPAHAQAFQRMTQTVAQLQNLPAPARRPRQAATGAPPAPASSTAWRPTQTPRPQRTHSGRAAWHKPRMRARLLAVLCCAFVILGVGWHHWAQQPTFAKSYAAERGQRRHATLPDGSELAIDANTRVQVQLYRDRREVRLTEGQIMLTVAPNPDQPLDVLAGPARIRVVGTRFSVRYGDSGMDAGQVRVAVEEGHVRVSGASGERSPDVARSVDLLAGQGIRVSQDGELGAVASLSPASIAPWRKGMVHFENTALADALRELERYGPTGLVIQDPAVAALPIGGSYRIDRPGDFARMLPQILPVRLAAKADGTSEIVRAPSPKSGSISRP